MCNSRVKPCIFDDMLVGLLDGLFVGFSVHKSIGPLVFCNVFESHFLQVLRQMENEFIRLRRVKAYIFQF